MTDHQKRPLCSAVGMELTPGTDTTRSSTKGPSALLSGGSMSERRGDLVQRPLPVTLMCLLTSSASPPKYRLGPGLAALCLSAITLRRKASRRSRRCVWRCIDVAVYRCNGDAAITVGVRKPTRRAVAASFLLG